MKRGLRSMCLSLMLVGLLLAACSGRPAGVVTPTPQPDAELVLYNWAEYMPQAVLDAFEAEYGTKVIYETYEDEEQAAEKVRASTGEYDVVVLPPERIAGLALAGKLAEMNSQLLPNFKNISADFRDLQFDPRNRYSVPFHWGSTGILVRSDLVSEPVTQWADLWRPAFAGKVGLWPVQRALIPIVLKSLGYPANSEDAEQLAEARARLLALKPNAVQISNDNASITPFLADGTLLIGYGWAYDALLAQEEGLPVAYILPEEGTFFWSDHFVIPASSRRQVTASLFINFILRPEISAQIINESYYPMPNDAARPFVAAEILNNPIIYPSQEQMRRGEIIVSLSEEGQRRYNAVWEEFMQGWPAGEVR